MKQLAHPSLQYVGIKETSAIAEEGGVWFGYTIGEGKNEEEQAAHVSTSPRDALCQSWGDVSQIDQLG
jgi:hypothetical protein